MVIGIPSQAKYGIFNDHGEQVYFAFEGLSSRVESSRVESIEEKKMSNVRLESDICQRIYCPKTRRFDLHVVDSTNQV